MLSLSQAKSTTRSCKNVRTRASMTSLSAGLSRSRRSPMTLSVFRFIRAWSNPLTFDPQLTPHLDKYPNADLLWCQEEPLNNGAWTYVGPRIMTAANETQHHKGKYPLYAGREPTSSVATGSKTIHKKQIEQFLAAAFGQ